MVGDVEKMVAVGLVWGATNAFMRRGAIIWDQRLKSSPDPNTPHHHIKATITNWVNLILTWQYSLPFFLNLSASATFFAILNDTPISLAVPVTNATTFAATAVFGMILGEKTRVGLALFGTLLIVLGLCVRVVHLHQGELLKTPIVLRRRWDWSKSNINWGMLHRRRWAHWTAMHC